MNSFNNNETERVMNCKATIRCILDKDERKSYLTEFEVINQDDFSQEKRSESTSQVMCLYESFLQHDLVWTGIFELTDNNSDLRVILCNKLLGVNHKPSEIQGKTLRM